MKPTAILSILFGIAAASLFNLDKSGAGRSAQDLEEGDENDCPNAILIFARGSTETGNLGFMVGPPLMDSFNALVANVWVQGVGDPYLATLDGNNAARGSPERAISEGVRLFMLAQEKCPSTPIVAGGWSQGAALIAAAISDLTPTTRQLVKGVALFGYTKNEQNGGRVPGYPAEQTKVFCAPGDLVCEGELIVTVEHFSYGPLAEDEGSKFLSGRI